MNNENQMQQKNGNSNKIYFLAAVIVVLLGTNIYLYFKNQKANERVSVISDEKTQMQMDIDKIELQLDSANAASVKLSDQMKEEQEKAQEKIAELRSALRKGQLTKQQLIAAQQEIQKLREFVTQYTAQIEELKSQNASLTTERNSLKSQVDSVSQRAGSLQKQNEDLNNKVTIAAAIKAGSVDVLAFRVRRNGKETEVTKAKTASKLRINFTVVSNSLASQGMHDVFVRIMDPAGNQLSGDNVAFIANNTTFESTYKTGIEYVNETKAYSIDWVNPNAFKQGTYAVILYADGYTMGQGTVTLQ